MSGKSLKGLASGSAALLLAALGAAGCGGGGSSTGSSSSDAGVVAAIETACAKAAGYSVWLPEHQAKSHLSITELEAAAREGGEEFRATLESLDPPADLRGPVEELAAYRLESTNSKKKLLAGLAKEEGLYRAAGAERCAEGMRAAILTFEGASVKAAYRQVGLPLPPKPAGW
jgi:hypothetical protein